MRVFQHPILDEPGPSREVTLYFNGKPLKAFEGEPVAAALVAAGVKVFRYSVKYNQPRGVFCAVGRCTDCVMTVNGVPNVRTCITPVEDGMRVEVQHGLGSWGLGDGER